FLKSLGTLVIVLFKRRRKTHFSHRIETELVWAKALYNTLNRCDVSTTKEL
ncbi:20816_t:CDS:2, partial [Gigaspora rosea]